jgi:dihydroorotate dehydrogenase
MGQKLYLKRISENQPDGFLGINIGPNKDTKNKEEDYFLCLSRLSNDSGYITINISSPNTEGLRNFSQSRRNEKIINWIK